MLDEKEMMFIKSLCDNITVPENYSRNPLDDIEKYKEEDEDE